MIKYYIIFLIIIFPNYGFSKSIVADLSSDSISINTGFNGAELLLFGSFDGFEGDAQFSLEEDVFPELVSRRKLGFVKLESSFIDIGIPEDYLKFCNWIELGRSHEL